MLIYLDPLSCSLRFFLRFFFTERDFILFDFYSVIVRPHHSRACSIMFPRDHSNMHLPTIIVFFLFLLTINIIANTIYKVVTPVSSFFISFLGGSLALLMWPFILDSFFRRWKINKRDLKKKRQRKDKSDARIQEEKKKNETSFGHIQL